jgi:DNA-binding NarL/FixJ family response regulator
MDVRMPGLDGVAATQMLTDEDLNRDVDAPVKILILTTYHVDEAVYAALRAGASGFLLKDAAPDELAAAIRAVAAGEAWLDPAVARKLLDEFAARPERQVPTPAQMKHLTTRECEVMVLVAYGLSNTEIAARLVVSEATVKTHLSRVIMKLGLRDRAQVVMAAYQNGLVKPGTTLPAVGGPPSTDGCGSG